MRRRASSASLLAGYSRLECSMTHRTRQSLEPDDIGRLSNLMAYPFKKDIPRLLARHRNEVDDIHDRRSLPELSIIDTFLAPNSNEFEIHYEESTEVSFRDGSKVMIPPSDAPNSLVDSVTGDSTLVVLTTKWNAKKLGLILQNINNRCIIKEITDAVDLECNPDLGTLHEGDELVSINDESTIIMGFEKTVARLQEVPKPAMLHFRRVQKKETRQSRESICSTHRSSEISSLAIIAAGHAETLSPNPLLIFQDTFIGSSPINTSVGQSIMSSCGHPMIVGIPSSTPMLRSPPSADFDVDAARGELCRTEIFPLSTDTDKVFTMIKWAGEPLGIALQKNEESEMEVKFCTGDGLAASFGCISVGDVLLSVSGVRMKRFSLATCLDFLHAAQKPASMLFRRSGHEMIEIPPPPPKTEGPVVWTVNWSGREPWGLQLKHFYCHRHLILIVSAISSMNPIFERLSVGDRLVSINDAAVDILGIETTMQILTRSAESQSLQLTFHIQDREWMV